MPLDELAGRLKDLGEYDEALRIRREQELPMVERLGDVRSKAGIQGQIAGIPSPAVNSMPPFISASTNVLPVYERLGSARDVMRCRGWIARILLERAHLQDRPRAEALMRQALAAARAMQLPEAAVIENVLRKHGFDPA